MGWGSCYRVFQVGWGFKYGLFKVTSKLVECIGELRVTLLRWKTWKEKVIVGF